MTIIEQILRNTLLTIEEEKISQNRIPRQTLVIGDHLRQRVEEALGQSVTIGELNEALISLIRVGKVKTGPTLNDTYVEIVYNEKPRSL